ncbi:MAG: DUF4373 domain-containing protein [Clostridia bacterium]
MKGNTPLKYFPHKTQQDFNFKLLRVKFGSEGYGVYWLLKEYIESQNPVYCSNFGADEAQMFAANCNISFNKLKALLYFCFEKNIFDGTIYKKYKILTSEEIQSEFLDCCKERKSFEVDLNILLPSSIEKIKEINNYRAEKSKDSVGKNKEKERGKEIVHLRLNENMHSEEFELAITKFKKAFPNKYVKDVLSLPMDLNMDLFIQKIQNSNFLKNYNNLTLKVMLKEKNYDKIISDVYADKEAKVSFVDHGNGIIKKEYSTGQLNALFDSLDEIDL